MPAKAGIHLFFGAAPVDRRWIALRRKTAVKFMG